MVKTAQGNVSAHKPFISQSTILHICSVYLHYRPDVTPVYAALVSFPSETFVHTCGVNGKWQNWNHSRTYCSTHCKQKIALLSLSGCISSIYTHVHSLRSMLDLDNYFLCLISICAIHSQCIGDMGILRLNSLHKNCT